MLVADAQREVRTAFAGGFMGQLVSGALWLASAALGTWGSPRQAILCLVIGGFFIFPATQLGLRILGHAGRLSPGNPLQGLAIQVAFVLPLCLPVVGAAGVHDLAWFYPAFMVVLGAHYLPFIFLYGMRIFGPLAGILVTAGVGLGMRPIGSWVSGAWLTGGILLAFSALGRWLVRGDLDSSAPSRTA